MHILDLRSVAQQLVEDAATLYPVPNPNDTAIQNAGSAGRNVSTHSHCRAIRNLPPIGTRSLVAARHRRDREDERQGESLCAHQ
ncbi:hypothetical protein [Palleronia sp.]|uniref:hypothetical protein n=1 Tax=Palleronia sp. TaxID=1940284 RepID=UPI0035C814DE